ncbi:MAG: hypothetical protein JO108_05505 [Acidobacteriaceae bacterium]|nr:hypothetical protein [Acidobacteriaceae bacterium]
MRRIRAFPLLFWLVSSAGSLVAGKEQGCVAPSDIPCYTLDVVTDEWNLTDVFHISYRGSVREEALRSDGSAVVREERTNGIWPFGSSQRIGRLYLARFRSGYKLEFSRGYLFSSTGHRAGRSSCLTCDSAECSL